MTPKKGTCINCKEEFFYSIGTPHTPLPIKGQKVENIETWFESIGNQCQVCAPIPDRLRSQAGIVIWRNVPKSFTPRFRRSR